MKTAKLYNIMAATAGLTAMIVMAGCDPMLDTSLNMSTVPGVNIGVGVSTPITGFWDDGVYPPFWSGGIAGVPAWGIGAPGWTTPPPRPPMRPGIPVNRPTPLPTRPVVPPAGTVRPYPTGPGPVVGGSGLPVLRPGATVRPGGNNSTPPATTPPRPAGGSFRPGAR